MWRLCDIDEINNYVYMKENVMCPKEIWEHNGTFYLCCDYPIKEDGMFKYKVHPIYPYTKYIYRDESDFFLKNEIITYVGTNKPLETFLKDIYCKANLLF